MLKGWTLFRYRLMLQVVGLIRQLFSYRLGIRCASAVVKYIHPFLVSQQPDYIRGLHSVFDDRPKVSDAWQVHRSIVGVTQFHTSHYIHSDPNWISHCRLTVHGADKVKQASQSGNGVLVMTYHLHFNMFFCSLLGTLGLPVTTIAMDPRESGMFSQFGEQAVRMYAGAEKHFQGGRFAMVKPNGQVRPIIRALDENHLVVTANDFPDVFDDKNRKTYPFLNTRLSCPTGTVKLAVKRNCPVVIGYLEWSGGDQFVMHLDVINTDSGNDPESQVDLIMKKYLSSLAQVVEHAPGLWEGWKWIGQQEE